MSIAFCVWEHGANDLKVCIGEFVNAPDAARRYADRCSRRSGKSYTTSSCKLPSAA